MKENKILALKYRPKEFDDLIGQEVMVQTVTNAINLGKTPNAYLLTGIRGVGKTTTARLIAKALNCEKNIDDKVECSKDKLCQTCEEIINSNHIDILEMDAASKTGIDDIRELIENSKYSPTSAQYKIFIIDEVHMLSKQAFNGLLKTLEEPPSRLKFILATTEVRKIPVTILSRCQRFDLKRVSVEKLFKHLKFILEKESGKVSDDALKLIAKSSEGSVRDSISLLDRALISQKSVSKIIMEPDIREMLGLADRSKIILLLKEVLNGNEKDAIKLLKELIVNGIDAQNFLNDILEILYFFSRRSNLGPIEKDVSISETELKMIDELSKGIDMQDIALFWQFTIKTIDDLKIVSNENLMLEMYIMQLVHIKGTRNKDEIYENTQDQSRTGETNLVGKSTKEDKSEIDISTQIKNQLKSTEQIKNQPVKSAHSEINTNKIEITSFQDLIHKADKEKEVELKYDLERNVKLVSFNRGKIDISFNEKLNQGFIKNLTEKLLSWTGERWIISLSKNDNVKSLHEQNMEKKLSKVNEFKDSDLAKKIELLFPDAKLIDIKEGDND